MPPPAAALLSAADAAAIEARIRAVEAATGAEVVAAIVERSDGYHGLRWRAFALGAALAGLAVVIEDLARPGWISAHAALVAVVAILGAGLAFALAATLWPGFARLFLQRLRSEPEARQRASAMFLERELFATPARNAVLLFVSRYEHAVVVLGDRAYAGRVSTAQWQGIVDTMTVSLRGGGAREAFETGLAQLESLLLATGFRGDGVARNVLPDRPLEAADDAT
jgi:putative membrane protein